MTILIRQEAKLSIVYTLAEVLKRILPITYATLKSDPDLIYWRNQAIRTFVVHANEPPVLLGEDQATNPVEYLLKALAACLIGWKCLFNRIDY